MSAKRRLFPLGRLGLRPAPSGKKCGLLLVWLLCATPGPGAHAAGVTEILARLRSADVFERQRAEAELRQLGPDSLVSLSEALLSSERGTRFRAGVVLSEMLQTLLMEYERERHAFDLDLRSLTRLQARPTS